MRDRILPLLLALLLLAGPVLVASTAQGPPEGPQQVPDDVSWHTVDNGGATYMQGGRFRLGGTIAQPDAGYLAGGRYGLLGGWWGGPIPLGRWVCFVPLVPRNYAVGADLVVESLEVTGNGVTLVLRNAGNGPVLEEFWIDVYVDPDPPPTGVNQLWNDLGAQGLVWGVALPALPLLPGESLTLSVGDAYFWPSYSYVEWPLEEGTAVYAQADSYNPTTTYGAVREVHEATGGPYNNIAGPVYVGPGLAGERPVWGADPASSGGLPPRPGR